MFHVADTRAATVNKRINNQITDMHRNMRSQMEANNKTTKDSLTKALTDVNDLKRG